MPYLDLVLFGEFDAWHRLQSTIHRNKIARRHSVQWYRLGDLKLSRTRTSQICQVRSAPESLPEIMRKAANVGPGGTHNSEGHQRRIKADDCKFPDFYPRRLHLYCAILASQFVCRRSTDLLC